MSERADPILEADAQAAAETPARHAVLGGRSRMLVAHLAAWALLTGGAAAAAGARGDLKAAWLLGLAAAPGVLGQAALIWPSLRVRQGVLLLWIIVVAVAAGASGGLSGPMAALCLTPLGAGLVLDGRRLGAAGAGGAAFALAAASAGGLARPQGVEGDAVLAAWLWLVSLGFVAMPLLNALADERRAAAKARRTAAWAEALLAEQHPLVLLMDAAGRVLRQGGQAPEGLAGLDLQQAGLMAGVHAPERSHVVGAIETALRTGHARTEFAPRLTPDRRMEMQLSRRADGSLIATLTDVTAVRAREAALETARANAEALNAGKSRFLANMSHELRTPLNAVIGFSDIMRRKLFGPMPDRYLEYAGLIHESGGHLLDLINDLLDMSKIEAERFELDREPLDARDAVNAALRLVRLQAHDKGVGLRAILPGEPLMVEADRRAMKQILINLVNNAVKFTPSGGTVTVTAEARDDVLELVVADTGVGIAADDLERLGRPYEQAGDAEQKARGTGLGLSLVKALAQLHGGRMSVESTVGEGTAVTVRMPVVLPPEPARPSAKIIPLEARGDGA
ncbi:HAMP domain-containing sensor histidine kinase [Brevundimonas sp. 2R-24]|uniref:histidine kinase n=1 Tax=Peiella sedimenti TaxID=3061083 RepID=A0ABT8SIH4_9CAUL|nr:HAMP domain-containing sensor histidine kinase [Caulobacteraceae bacterium XZ-24]